MPMPRILSTLTIAVLFVCHVVAAETLYISVAKENRIAAYHLDTANGELTHAGDTKIDGQPGPLTIHPNRKILVASVRSEGNLASFAIASDGTLTPISVVSAGADPAYVAVDPSGRYLVSAYYRAAKVMVHRLTDDGKILSPLQTIPTDEKAHAAVSDSTATFWFIPHTGPNAIYQFVMNKQTGLLKPNSPPILQRSPNTGPRHLWFHPHLNVAYTSDEQGRAASAYQFDPGNGTLELIQTLSTLPPDFQGDSGGSTSDCEVHPSGIFLYVANRGHDSIARYKIDSKSGRLAYLGNTRVERTTRSFNINGSGDFLVAAGQNADKVAVFRIDKRTGDLNRLQTVEVGKTPWWVEFR